MRRLLFFVIKEFIQFRRDKKTLGFVFVAPILQLIFLGYAANMDVKVVDTAIWDRDNSQISRKYIQRLCASDYFRITHFVRSYKEISEFIDRNQVLMAIVIPEKFEAKIQKSEKTSVQIILDGSNGNKASIAFGYLMNITNSYAKAIVVEKIAKHGLNPNIIDKFTAETRIWYNPEMVTRVFILPGIMALVLLIVTVPLTAMAIVREKEVGTLEQLIVTPLSSYQIILGKMIPYSFIGFVIFILVANVMQFWFGIEVRGSFLFLLFVSGIFVVLNLALGLFISTISKNQQQAMMVSVFGFIVPMIYLSGFVFPVENMPQIIQYITIFIPLKYYLIVLRGVVLKGIGFAELWQETLVLVAFAIVLMGASVVRFRKKLG